MKVKSDHCSKVSNLSNWKEEAWKNIRGATGFEPVTSQYRCDAWPTELWSHTLGARSICWVHIFLCSEMMWNIYEIFIEILLFFFCRPRDHRPPPYRGRDTMPPPSRGPPRGPPGEPRRGPPPPDNRYVYCCSCKTKKYVWKSVILLIKCD